MGTPANFNFSHAKGTSIYSHYDGYPSGAAAKLHEGLSHINVDDWKHGHYGQSLINRFIAGNVEYVELQTFDDKSWCEYEYWIDEKDCIILWSRMGGVKRKCSLAQWINEQCCQGAKDAYEYDYKKYKSYKQFVNDYADFDPAVQFEVGSEFYKSTVITTVSKALEIAKLKREYYGTFKDDNPNKARGLDIADLIEFEVAQVLESSPVLYFKDLK